MATTTNYSWTTPDDTSLVKDGAAAIRSLGSSIDTTTKNLNPATTLGDIQYRSSTANTNTRLPIGSTGNVLTVAGGVPTWAAPAAGKIVQVVSTTKTDSFSSSTLDVFTDITGMSVAITPTSATSQVLVFVDLSTACTYNNTVLGWRIVRNSTAIAVGDAAGNRSRATNADIGGDFNGQLTSAAHFLDSPATTSALTYKLQFLIDVGTFYLNRSPNDTDGANIFRTVSSITVMEIGA
jgi:hypothetical protein